MSETGEGRLDLTGEWSGVYSYPQLLPPVPFTASLTDRAGEIGGVIAEQSGDASAKRLTASVQGRRTGTAVTFLKMYDVRSVDNDIDYAGEISSDGMEISGQWSIVGDWSGTFLMVRRVAEAIAEEREAGALTSKSEAAPPAEPIDGA